MGINDVMNADKLKFSMKDRQTITDFFNEEGKLTVSKDCEHSRQNNTGIPSVWPSGQLLTFIFTTPTNTMEILVRALY